MNEVNSVPLIYNCTVLEVIFIPFAKSSLKYCLVKLAYGKCINHLAAAHHFHTIFIPFRRCCIGDYAPKWSISIFQVILNALEVTAARSLLE